MQKFAAIVEAGSFTAAAKNIHVSQPALSVAIGKLEKSLKTKLFRTTGRGGVELTEAGRLVYDAALQHRTVDHNMAQQIAGLSDEKVQLGIGMIDSVAALLTSRDEPLRTLEERTELTVLVSNSGELRAALMSGQIDIAVVVANKAEDAKLQVGAHGAEQLVLVASAATAPHFQALLERNAKLPYIAYVPASTTSQHVLPILARDGVLTETILYSTSQEVMLQMALRGRGATLLPEHIVAPKIATGELVALTLRSKPYVIERQLSIVSLKGRKMPPGLADIAHSVAQQFKNFTW